MKKFNKKLFSTALALMVGVSVVAGAGCNGGGDQTIITDDGKVNYTIAKTWEKEELHTYFLDSVGENIMPVCGFGGPYTPSGITYNGHVQPDFNDDYYWDLMDQAGVNTIVFAWNEYRSDAVHIMRALDQAHKRDMSYFVRDNYMGQFYNGSKTLEDVVKDYIDHPGCAGVYGRDEPGGNDYASYAKLSEAMYGNERFEGKDVYMNLLPTYASTSAFGKYKNYEGYVRGYIEECSYMPYIAYDHYPYKNAATCDLDKMNAPDYFLNLSIVRKVALEYGVPFWTYYCVGEVGGTEYPIFPDKEAYFWNINSNLVYGAKGLQLYSVIQSPVDEDLTDAAADPVTGWNYERFGLVGAIGNVNRWWHYQVEFDKHLKVIDEYLMNAQNVGVIGVGKRAAYLGVGPEVITEGSFRELTSVTADEALVGCFDYDGTTMLYVLNNDINVKQKIALNFDDKYGYDVYQRGELASIAGKTLTLTLEAGEAALVKLRTE